MRLQQNKIAGYNCNSQCKEHFRQQMEGSSKSDWWRKEIEQDKGGQRARAGCPLTFQAWWGGEWPLLLQWCIPQSRPKRLSLPAPYILQWDEGITGLPGPWLPEQFSFRLISLAAIERSGLLFRRPWIPLCHQPLFMLTISDFRLFYSRKSWSRVITALLSLHVMPGVCSSVLRGLESWETRMDISMSHKYLRERDRERHRQSTMQLPPTLPSLSHLKVFFSPPLLQHLSPTPCPPLSPFISDWATEFKIIRSGFQAGKCIQTCYQCYHRSSSPSQSPPPLSFFLHLSLCTVQWYTILCIICFGRGCVCCILSSFAGLDLFEVFSSSGYYAQEQLLHCTTQYYLPRWG